MRSDVPDFEFLVFGVKTEVDAPAAAVARVPLENPPSAAAGLEPASRQKRWIAPYLLTLARHLHRAAWSRPPGGPPLADGIVQTPQFVGHGRQMFPEVAEVRLDARSEDQVGKRRLPISPELGGIAHGAKLRTLTLHDWSDVGCPRQVVNQHTLFFDHSAGKQFTKADRHLIAVPSRLRRHANANAVEYYANRQRFAIARRKFLPFACPNVAFPKPTQVIWSQAVKPSSLAHQLQEQHGIIPVPCFSLRPVSPCQK